MTIIFFIIYIFWLVSEIFINRLLRSGSSDQKNKDGNTLVIIWLSIIASITSAVFIYYRYPLFIANGSWVSYTGLLIIFLGCLLRFVAIASLGRQFTADVTIRQNHQLVKTGIYKYLRHPTYTFSLLSFVGFGLSLNNWLSLVIVVVAVSAAFLRRIRTEEKLLTQQFGAEYLAYKKDTYGLLPFIL